MPVVSGPIGGEWVHYEAPSAPRLEAEMSAFLKWFNDEAVLDPVLKAALAHLWFVTIHPFDDGNGRMARAIADMALARSEQSVQRFYSMSAQIRLERNAYTISWKQRREAISTSPHGWNGFSAASTARSKARRRRFPASCARRASGKRSRTNRSMRASAKSSTFCWTALRVSSPRPNGRLLRSHRQTRPCATLPILSNGASSFETLVADAARVTHWPRWNEEAAVKIIYASLRI
jgi:prophage maintenance system killer protein